MAERCELRCRECGKSWGNQARSFCDDCLSPLEITYDYEAVGKNLSRASIEAGPNSIWRYRALLPVDEVEAASLPVGFTPLVPAKGLGQRWGARHVYVKNDAVCFEGRRFTVTDTDGRRLVKILVEPSLDPAKSHPAN